MINQDMISNVYSEKESKTDKTFLGKPVYSRVIINGAVKANTETAIKVTDANMDVLVSIQGIGETADGKRIPLNFNNVEYDIYKSFLYYVFVDKLVRYKTKFDTTAAIVILEYTKTTD